MYKFYAFLARSMWVRRIFSAVFGGLSLWVGIAGFQQNGPILQSPRSGLGIFELTTVVGVVMILAAFLPWRNGTKPAVRGLSKDQKQARKKKR